MKVTVSGECPTCHFVHEKTETTIYLSNGKLSRYAKCVKCNDVLPFKIEGCTCTEDRNHKIIIGDCPIHQFLKEQKRQS